MTHLMTKDHVNQTEYFQIPKAFFQDPKYLPMKSDAKLAYMLILDLLPLSVQNNWINKNGEVFVRLPREDLMALLNIKSTQKFALVMKALVGYELIIYKKVGLTKCNEIYIYSLEDN